MEKVNLSAWQLFTMTFCFCMGTTIIILPVILLKTAKQYSYLACLFHLIIGVIIATIWLYLSKKNPGKSLVQIITYTFGKWVGGFICLFYIVFFIQIAAWVSKNLTDFIHINIMPKTPIIIFIITVLLLSSYTSVKGIESIARVSEILFVFGLIAYYVPMSFIFGEWDWNNFNIPSNLNLIDSMINSKNGISIPYMEGIAFLMIFPYVPRRPNLGFLIGFIASGVIFSFTTFLTIGILGIERSTHLIYPLYTMFREIRLSFLFEHLESIMSVNILLFVIFKLCILHYCTVMAICQVFKIDKREIVSYPVIWIIAGFAMINKNVIVNIEWIESYLFTYYLPFSVFLPILLICATWYKQKNTPRMKGIKNNYD